MALSDASGNVELPVRPEWPLRVRCLGFEEAVALAGTDTVYMCESAIGLPAVEVSASGRDVVRLICYVREYAGAVNEDDSLTMFSEYMVDYFFPMTGVKKFKAHTTPRTLAWRAYCRHTDSQGRDTVEYCSDDVRTLSWLQLARIDPTTIHYTANDSVYGKYGYKSITRMGADALGVYRDMLADHKDHRMSPWFLKLLGLTVDITELYAAHTYAANESGEYGPEDVVSCTYSLKMLGRGKLFKLVFDNKRPVNITSYLEIYTVDRTYMSVAEAKTLLKGHPDIIPMAVPEYANPLDAPTQALVERVRREYEER